MRIEDKYAYDGLDAEDSCGVQGGAVSGARSVLNFGTVKYWSMLVWGVLWLGRLGVFKFDMEVGNVVLHCESTSALDVVPLNIFARV